MDRTCPVVDAPPPARRANRDLADRLAVLEIANHTLRVEAERSAEQGRFRLAEVEHRLMNIFGVIGALVSSTARPGDTGESFRASLVPRLMALASSHALLGASHAAAATLDEVMRRCLEPHDDGCGRITLCGPVVLLPACDVPNLGLAVHELVTNAAKHGALSVSTGRIDVTWQLTEDAMEGDRVLMILWREQDGPDVQPPERRGFGSQLLERGLGNRHGSAVRLVFAADGVECHIRLPLAPV